jgi:hypothetical protein
MDRNSDHGSFSASITAVVALTIVIGVLYLPLFL